MLIPCEAMMNCRLKRCSDQRIQFVIVLRMVRNYACDLVGKVLA